MICDICKGDGAEKFATSGAMWRGRQCVWSGYVCVECFLKYNAFELEIVYIPREATA